MSKYNSSDRTQFYIGVDGGGTSCRARIDDAEGRLLGRGVGGPAATAAAKDYASLAPVVLSYTEAGDPFAKEIVAEGAWRVGVLIHSPVDFGAPRISLLGGLASRLVRWLSPDGLHFLSPPEDDAVAGALLLARREGPAPTEPRRQSKGTQIC